MPADALTGTIVLRNWTRTSGLKERPQTFSTLDELYALCLGVESPDMIDRIIIQGRDAEGAPRVLTFVFQSITVSPT
jgi:hypothetical protein